MMLGKWLAQVLCASVACVGVALAQEAVDWQGEPLLPRNMTEREQLGQQQPWQIRIPSAPPAADVRTFAEYERNDGIIMRWVGGSLQSTQVELIRKATTLDDSAKVWLIVNSTGAQTSATTALSGGGANLARVLFVPAPTSPAPLAGNNSVWARDYGPRFIYENGRRAIVDHTYNRDLRTNDNAVPSMFAGFFGEPLYDIGLRHGGGNYHLFDDRPAYMTRLILSENPSLNQTQILDRYRVYQGAQQELAEPFPISFDSTQHIDMWLLPTGARTAIVGQYAPSTGQGAPFAATEAMTSTLSARGVQVIRTPGWQSGGTHFTYTNAVILNNLVLGCRFNGFPNENALALTAFQQAFPGRTIDTVDCSSLITLAGAIHCIVMHVPFARRRADLFEDGFEN